MQNSPKLQHIVELDAVRGIAAIAVVYCHLPRGFWFGETSVDLFFVLSGFLISRVILQGRHQEGFLRSFFARRALRIFPPYYLTLVTCVLLNIARSHPQSMDGLLNYFLYLQNVEFYWGQTPAAPGIPIGHTWTLAIEEQYYLIWPGLLLLLRGSWQPAVASFALICLGPIMRGWFGLDRAVLAGHTDGLAYGSLLACVLHGRDNCKRPTLVFAAFACFSVVAYWTYWIFYFPGAGKGFVKDSLAIALISAAYFGIIGFVVTAAGSRQLVFLRSDWLRWLGQRSYGLYLYHWVVFDFLDTIFVFKLGFNYPYWLDALQVLTSVALAQLSWVFLEHPLSRLKDRIAPGIRQVA